MKVSKNIGLTPVKTEKFQPQRNNKYNNCGLTSDVFQKSCPSFGSESDFDLFGSLMFNYVFGFMDLLSDVFKYQKKEIIMSGVIEALNTKQVKGLLKAQKSRKIEYLTSGLFQNFGSDDEYFNKIFKDAGIKNFMQLDMFLKSYSQNPNTKNVFLAQGIEAVKIYGLLKNKGDFSRFDELLLYIYNNEEDSENPDFEKLNTTVEFLKQLGLTEFKDFSTKFAHLKDKFNDFKTLSDKMDAVEYLKQTYSKKIGYLNSMLQNQSGKNSSNASKVYEDITDVVDYLFEKNNGESLEPLNRLIDIASDSRKIKPVLLRNCEEYFNGFKNPEDKIDLYEILYGCNLSVQDLNMLAGKSLVSDNELLNNIMNMEPVSKEISKQKGVNENNAKAFYAKFKDFYDAVYDCSFKDTDGVKILTKLIDRYKITNADMLLSFYNNSYGAKQKTVTTEEFRNFIELFNYSDSDKLVSEAKSKQTTVVALLKQEKEYFERVEDKIIDFILNDETAYFSDMTPLDIYKKYKDLINAEPESVSELLSNLRNFNADNSEEYNEKIENLNKFSAYFSKKEDLISFITKNGIKLTSNPEDSEYRQACLDVIECINSGQRDEKEFKDIIKYLTDSGFLIRSKNSLPEFISGVNDDDKLNRIFEAVTSRKIKSVNALNAFIKKYQSEEGNYDNLIKHLLSCPSDVDFDRYLTILSDIQKRFNALNIPVELNNNNINAIDVSKLTGIQKIPNESLFSILDNIFDSKKDGVNFMAKLPNALTGVKTKYSRFRIAKEIVDKLDLTDESYNNIARLLKLDRKSLNIDESYSDYMYTKCVEKMLPQEFIDFVNSTEWLTSVNASGKSLNMTLHAKLRAIDRFILAESDSIETLYTKESINRLRSLFEAVFVNTPINIKGSDESKRIITNCSFENNIIEAVFTKQGEMITIVPKKKHNC